MHMYCEMNTDDSVRWIQNVCSGEMYAGSSRDDYINIIIIMIL